MKKFIITLLAATMLFTLASCGPKSSASLGDVLSEINNISNVSSVSSSDSAEILSTPLTVAETVKEDFHASGTYTYGGKKINYSYKYPQLTLPNVSLTEINSRIKNYCSALIDVELKAMAKNSRVDLTEMKYTACIKDNVLSLLITSVYGTDYTLYEAININTDTGAELNKENILNAAGMTTTDGMDKIKAAAESKFLQLYGKNTDYSTDEIEAYEKAKKSTLLDFDVDMTLYFNEIGALKAIVRIYEPTGEDYGYHEVSVK